MNLRPNKSHDRPIRLTAISDSAGHGSSQVPQSVVDTTFSTIILLVFFILHHNIIHS